MTQIGGSDPRFQPTQWTVVQRAADPSHPETREALERLIESYWKPVYVYIRRRGHTIEDAKDLAQAFFTKLIETAGLAGADSQRGRFRNYLLGAVNHFLSNQAAAARAQKRGGGQPLLSLDFNYGSAESECKIEPPASESTPEEVFARSWARTVLDQAMQTLRTDLEAEDKTAYYEALQLSLGPEPRSYQEIAEALELDVSDVTNYLHRARKRYRQTLLRTVLPSVSSMAEAEAELRDLLGTLQ